MPLVRMRQPLALQVGGGGRVMAAEKPQPDPRVGLNPTGRPRRSSAPSRRKQQRRHNALHTPTPNTTPEEAS